MDFAEYDSRNRLHHLRQLREQHFSVTRDLGREVADLRAIVAAAQTRLAQLASQPAELGMFGATAIAQEAERLAKRIADVEAELSEITARQRNAQDAAQSAGRLLDRCIAFAREKGLPLPHSLRDEGIHAKAVGL